MDDEMTKFSSSVAPWDRPRKSTTITLWNDEPLPDLPDIKIEHDNGARIRKERGHTILGRCLLISWKNDPDAPRRLCRAGRRR